MAPENETAAQTIARAARNRHDHYRAKGAKPLPWEALTDAQKLPWLLAAVTPWRTETQPEEGQ